MIEQLNALRAKRNPSGVDMDKFREDFSRAFHGWRAAGHYTNDEAAADYVAAAAAVREHQADSEWIAGAAAHFRQIVEQMDRDKAMSKRIAAEVRAQKKAEQAKGAA